MSNRFKKILLTILLFLVAFFSFYIAQYKVEKSQVPKLTSVNLTNHESPTKIINKLDVPFKELHTKMKDIGKQEKYENESVLYVDFINGSRVEVLKVEEFNGGEVRRITRRWPSGTISISWSGVLNGKDSGYNIDYRNGPYSDYGIDSLRELAKFGDREAELVLADKLLYLRKKEEAIKYVFSAARKGYTAGFDKLSMSYLIEGDQETSYAYKLLAYENAPDIKKKEYDKTGNHLTPEVLSKAKEILAQIQQEFDYYPAKGE